MGEKRRLRVGFISNCPLHKTGLGRNMKAILPILFKKDKWDIYMLNQQMGDNASEFLKLPWKNEGCMKNFDQNRFNQDGNYQRHVAYGNAAVEDWVTRNKLDAVILSDDFWAGSKDSYFGADWYKHMKENFMFVATADSEPLLPFGIEWTDNCPNMRFWCKFPVRVLQSQDKEKYKHCDVIYGALNTEQFKPLPKQERLQLRNKFGIKDDEKIIIYLGRNQLRKIYASHIEGLAKFRKRHPDKKLRLLFHCSWSELGGWPLNQIREQNGLKKEDILTSYYCRNCQDWNVQPYEGEDLECPHCKQRTRNTAGIGSTINEEDLNKIYNLADGSASIFTSGSFEFTNPESMLAGVPLAVPNYVCGEDFLDSGVVYQIKGNYTYEHTTGFKKFVPDINSVCDFFEYIYNLPENKRKEIIEKGRKWAIENFDAQNVAKKYEEFLDSRQPIDWDVYFNKKKELKDPSAPIENIQDDYEFIWAAYERILKMTDMRDKNKPEVIHWHKFINQPGDKNKLKNDMINTMRGVAAEKNREQQKITLEDILIKNNKKQVAVCLPESIGDIILATSIFKSLRNRYPKETHNLYFITKPEYFELLDLNENIDKILPYDQQMDNLLIMEGQGKNKGFFDIFYPIHFGNQRLLSYMHNGQDLIDINNK